MVCGLSRPLRSYLTDLLAQTACPAFKLPQTPLCLRLSPPRTPRLHAPHAVCDPTAVPLLHVPAPAGCCNGDCFSGSSGLVPGPHSWARILSSPRLLPEPSAEETAQECDVCGQPRFHSHSRGWLVSALRHLRAVFLFQPLIDLILGLFY